MFCSVSKVWKNLFAAAVFTGAAQAASPWKEVVSFSTVSNAGFGRSLYVVGNHADLGQWNPTAAVRLVRSTGMTWTGRVAVQAGTAIEYKFITRLNETNQYCEATNVEWMGGANLTSSTPAQVAAPYAGKTMYYHSAWTSAYVLFSTDASNFISTNLTQMGSGRTPGEYLYRASSFGVEGEPIQFVCYGFLNDTQYWDNAPYGGYGANDYYTPLDAFFLQDGDVSNYAPPPAPSSSSVVTQYIASSYTNIPGRYSRIYLPRGYTNNAWKQYPVLYMHDGQYVASLWSAWPTLDREIGQGRMRESIVVAVDAVNRCGELVPPGDSITLEEYCGGTVEGIGDQYGDYLIHDVKTYMDANYRTLAGRDDTLVMGSSLGGLISCWLAMRTNAYGAAGAMSPAFWTAPNFTNWIRINDSSGSRLYFDAGTDEGDAMWDYFWPVRGYLLQDGYAEKGDLLTAIGCGQVHNEAAWASRLPGALRYLLNLWQEPNWLAQTEYPPSLTWGDSSGGAPTSAVHYALAGFQYRLDVATNGLDDAWVAASTSGVQILPWSQLAWSISNAPPDAPLGLFRIVVETDD